jgi:hypothetical protein
MTMPTPEPRRHRALAKEEQEMEHTFAEPTVIRKAKTPLLALVVVSAMVLAAAVPALAQAGSERQATLSFELAVECEPPADATFFGNVRTGEGGPGIFAQLLDPDGDGLYTGVATLPDRFGPGPDPVPPGVEPVSLPVQIVQGTGTRSTGSGAFPGEPLSVVRDFGVVPMEAENEFIASVSFCEATASPTATATAAPTATAAASAQYATASPTATATASPTAAASVLPETGGGAGGAAGLMAIGAGALLVGGGLLARRIIR